MILSGYSFASLFCGVSGNSNLFSPFPVYDSNNRDTDSLSIPFALACSFFVFVRYDFIYFSSCYCVSMQPPQFQPAPLEIYICVLLLFLCVLRVYITSIFLLYISTIKIGVKHYWLGSVARYKQGEVKPLMEVADKIPKALNVTLEELLNGPSTQDGELRLIISKAE